MKLTQTERLIVALADGPKTTDYLYDRNGLNIPNYKGRKFDAVTAGCVIDVLPTSGDNNLHEYTLVSIPKELCYKIVHKLDTLGLPVPRFLKFGTGPHIAPMPTISGQKIQPAAIVGPKPQFGQNFCAKHQEPHPFGQRCGVCAMEEVIQ